MSMSNREFARWAALDALMPFAQSRLEDMAESDSACLLYREGASALALGMAAQDEGTTGREMALARDAWTLLRNEHLTLLRSGIDVASACGPNCPCKVTS